MTGELAGLKVDARAEPLNRPVRDKRALAKSPNGFRDFIAIIFLVAASSP